MLIRVFILQLSALIAISCPKICWGQEDPTQQQPKQSRPRIISVSIMPITKWRSGQGDVTAHSGEKVPGRNPPSLLSTSMSPSTFISYEGAYRKKSSRWSFSLTGDIAKDVENAYRIYGLLGYSAIALRIQHSSYSGTGKWNGRAMPNEASNFSFESDFSEVDLLYRIQVPYKYPFEFYFGLGYAAYTLPAQVNVLSNGRSSYSGQNYGEPVFQKDVQFDHLNVIVGFDKLESNLAVEPHPGFDLWLACELGMGFGKIKINDQTFHQLQELNKNWTVRNQNYNAMFIALSGTAGVMWTGKIFGTDMSFGAGWLYSHIGTAQFETEADKYPYGTGYTDVHTYLDRMGPVLKMAMRW